MVKLVKMVMEEMLFTHLYRIFGSFEGLQDKGQMVKCFRTLTDSKPTDYKPRDAIVGRLPGGEADRKRMGL